MQLSLVPHAVAGGVGIVSGFLALYTAKGTTLHRKAGIVFVYAMVTTSVLGFVLAAVRDSAPKINIPAAPLTASLVLTAVTTVRPQSVWSRRIDGSAMLVTLGIGITDFAFGIAALASGRKLGLLAIPYFLFGTIALVASAGDARTLRLGGRVGTARLARHLWRMSFALWIAAMSFFVGQADVIPEPIRIPGLLAMPGLVVLVTMLYWLWRMRIRGRYRGLVGMRTRAPV